MIPVTKPFLPPKEEYEAYLNDIWRRQWITNNGPLVNKLELKLKEYLRTKHLLFLSNGTFALQLAIRALDLKGEIITTPFSFVATTSSIVWERCSPVFVDIDSETLNINPQKIEEAVTDRTSAILATHVYGNPCDIDAIQQIARKYDLKVLYDGAHAFGVHYNGKSVFEYGDISICSLHATKLYHSVEGGLVITKNPRLLKKMAHMRNFGFDGPERFTELGVNGKNSEFHAAMGLINLKYIDKLIAKRQELASYYDTALRGLRARRPLWKETSTNNFGYYPLIFDDKAVMHKCLERLNRNNIFPRRYFFPSLSEALPYLQPKVMPVTNDIASRIICLPLYSELSKEEVEMICRLILRVQNNPLE